MNGRAIRADTGAIQASCVNIPSGALDTPDHAGGIPQGPPFQPRRWSSPSQRPIPANSQLPLRHMHFLPK